MPTISYRWESSISRTSPKRIHKVASAQVQMVASDSTTVAPMAQAQRLRAHKGAVVAATPLNSLHRKAASLSLLRFPRRFPRRWLACPRRYQMPESISIRFCGRSCHFRITAILVRNQLHHQMGQGRVAVLEMEKALASVKVKTTDSALAAGATPAATITVAAAVEKAVRRATIRMA